MKINKSEAEKQALLFILFAVVPGRGLEPPSLAGHAP